MQLPELFRRGVVAALDEGADAQLATWDVEDGPYVAWIPLASDSLFNEVWDAGVFKVINAECGTLIDDYEEEDLSPESLPKAIAALTRLRYSCDSHSVRPFLEKLIRLCELARREGRSVYFIL